MALDRVEEVHNDEERKLKQLFHHYDMPKDNTEDKNYRKRPSYIEGEESPIKETNENNEEEGKEAWKRLTPKGSIREKTKFNLINVHCDELDVKERKNMEKEYEETIIEEKEDLIIEKSGKKS